jgi:hypothetical protein
LRAVHIMDKFFAAGASPSSKQRKARFNIWKEDAFSSAEKQSLLMISALCFLVSCKVECLEVSPKMVELYQLIRNWDGIELSAEPFAEMASVKRRKEITASDPAGLQQLEDVERLVLADCNWGVTMITELDVISEVGKTTVDDPNFQQMKSIAIANVIRLTFDAKNIYTVGSSTTRIALAAISDAQLSYDTFSTPPTCRREGRLSKKRGIEDVEQETGSSDMELVESWGQMDPGLRGIVQRFMDVHNPFAV